MTTRNNRDAALGDSEKEVTQIPEASAKLWAHAGAEDVNLEYMIQGPGWYALFNPGLECPFDVSLVDTLTYRRCVSPHILPPARISKISLHAIQCRDACALLLRWKIPRDRPL